MSRRRPHVRIAVVSVAWLACADAPGQCAVESTFDASPDGWTTRDSGADVQWAAEGGNPGGHLTIEDVLTPGVATLYAPEHFLGDLGSFEEIRLDLRQVETNEEDLYRPAFGVVTISGPGGTASADLVTDLLPFTWQTYALPLDAATWGVTEPELAAILGAVEEISMDADSYQYTGDTIAIDNARLVCADACPADCNMDGALNILDFVCFQGLFQAGDDAADCNADGALNILDFVCFQALFQGACG